jgi:glutamine synthetase type III
MDIEVRTMLEIVNKDILPAMTEEYAFYTDVKGKKLPKFIENRIASLGVTIDEAYSEAAKLEELWIAANQEKEEYSCGLKIRNTVVPQMEKLRSCIDTFETTASRRFYQLPLYEDMLFNL